MVYLWIIPFLLYDIIRVDGVRFEEKSWYNRAYEYTILQKKGKIYQGLHIKYIPPNKYMIMLRFVLLLYYAIEVVECDKNSSHSWGHPEEN